MEELTYSQLKQMFLDYIKAEFSPEEYYVFGVKLDKDGNLYESDSASFRFSFIEWRDFEIAQGGLR